MNKGCKQQASMVQIVKNKQKREKKPKPNPKPNADWTWIIQRPQRRWIDPDLDLTVQNKQRMVTQIKHMETTHHSHSNEKTLDPTVQDENKINRTGSNVYIRTWTPVQSISFISFYL